MAFDASLRRALDRSGMSLGELARRVVAPVDEVQAWLSGDAVPTRGQLVRALWALPTTRLEWAAAMREAGFATPDQLDPQDIRNHRGVVREVPSWAMP